MRGRPPAGAEPSACMALVGRCQAVRYPPVVRKVDRLGRPPRLPRVLRSLCHRPSLKMGIMLVTLVACAKRLPPDTTRETVKDISFRGNGDGHEGSR